MKTLGWYNGRYDEIDNMSVPMNDRASWFGDGVYDAGPAVDYHIFAIDDHLDRFYRSASMLRIQIPMEKAELAATLNDLVRKMDDGDLFVYMQVTRGTAKRNHAFPENVPANLWIMLFPMPLNDGLTPGGVVTTEDTRFLHCNIKTLNLIPSVMASQEAKEAGCYESVFYRPAGRVTECAHSNVHILKDGVFRTAPLDNLILPGIARKHMIAQCKKLGIPVVEQAFFLPDLLDADEIITSSSTAPCRRVNTVDGKSAGMKDPALYERIRAAVMEEIYTEGK